MKTFGIVVATLAVAGAAVGGLVYFGKKGKLGAFGTAAAPVRPLPVQSMVPKPPPANGYAPPPTSNSTANDFLAWGAVASAGLGLLGDAYSAFDMSAFG